MIRDNIFGAFFILDFFLFGHGMKEMKVLAENQSFLCNVQIQPLPYPQRLTHHLSHKVQEWVFQ
jgi:hypothetical protein